MRGRHAENLTSLGINSDRNYDKLYNREAIFLFSLGLRKHVYDFVTTHFQLQAFQREYPVITYFAVWSQDKGILFVFRSFPFFLLDWN